MVCSNCGRAGHNKAGCRYKGRSKGGSGKRPYTCSNCGEDGHNISTCTKPGGRAARTVTCGICGETGHNRRGCPNNTEDLLEAISAMGVQRRCQHCHSTSHTASSCPVYAEQERKRADEARQKAKQKEEEENLRRREEQQRMEEAERLKKERELLLAQRSDLERRLCAEQERMNTMKEAAAERERRSEEEEERRKREQRRKEQELMKEQQHARETLQREREMEEMRLEMERLKVEHEKAMVRKEKEMLQQMQKREQERWMSEQAGPASPLSSENVIRQPKSIGEVGVFHSPKRDESSKDTSEQGNGLSSPHEGDKTRLVAVRDAVPEDYHMSSVDLREIISRGTPLGSGGSAKVFKSTLKSGEDIAVKVLLDRGISAKCLREFRKESQALLVLDHENVLKLRYVVADEEYLAMIFPLADCTLEDYAARDETTKEDILNALLCVAKGLRHLHGKQVEHRDLKPSNVLVMPDRRAVIADFGVSTMRTVAYTIGLTTGSNHFESGTLLYMAPEQLVANKRERKFQPSAQSDIWAFGIMANSLLSDTEPYQEYADPTDLPHFLRTDVAKGKVPIEASDEIGDSELVNMVNKCLEFDPSKRPSANEIVNMLVDIIHGKSEDIMSDQSLISKNVHSMRTRSKAAIENILEL